MPTLPICVIVSTAEVQPLAGSTSTSALLTNVACNDARYPGRLLDVRINTPTATREAIDRHRVWRSGLSTSSDNERDCENAPTSDGVRGNVSSDHCGSFAS